MKFEKVKSNAFVIGIFCILFSTFFIFVARPSYGQWAATYGGASTDIAVSIQQTSDGGYIVVGDTRSFGAGNYDFWIIKLDAGGDVVWQKTYGGGRLGRSCVHPADERWGICRCRLDIFLWCRQL